MKQFISGFIAAGILVAVAGFAWLALGFAPVATDSPPLPFERFLAHMALKARMSKDPLATSPIQPSDVAYTAGAQVYRENCAVCHGLPGQPQTAIARGEFPPPPSLFGKGKGVSDDPAGETYWKVANGIRLTGMPGYGRSLTTDQMWQVSLLLANSDKLPAPVMSALQKPLP